MSRTLPTAAEARAHPVAWAMYASGGEWQPARHLWYLSDRLMRLYRGEGKRLLISIPPGHGKSEFASKYYPAWHMGTRPETRVILTSYAQEITREWSRGIQGSLSEHGDVFGVTVNTRASVDRWDVFDAVSQRRTGGSMRAVGMEGAITGRRAEIMICDDPIKGPEQANSEAHREAVWEWWTKVALTRLLPHSVVFVIQTRWHSDDLAGRIQAQQDAGHGGEPWEIVNLPAIAEENDPMGREPGEALWPEVFSSEYLAKVRAEVGEHTWQCLYQGQPVPDGGQMFRREWLRYANLDAGAVTIGDTTHRDDGVTFATVDMAASVKRRADYTAIMVCRWLRLPKSLIVVDVIRDRFEAPDLITALESLRDKHGLAAIYVEEVDHQISLMQVLRRSGLPIRAIKADRDKQARALPVTAAMEAGWVVFQRNAHWLGQLERELMEFPHGKHDDQVDALAYAVRVAMRWRRDDGQGRRRYAQQLDQPRGRRGWRIGR